MSTMIEISAMKPFAIGGKRECYVHPEYSDRCVKILRKDADPLILYKNVSKWRSIRKTEDDFNESISD